MMDIKGARLDRDRATPLSPVWHGACQAARGGECLTPTGTLAADRLREIRHRIHARHHDDPEVVASVARRIVERGHL